MFAFRFGAVCLAVLAVAGCGKHGGAPGTPAAFVASQQWTTYADPAEHAFTMDVPAGWQVSGGLARFSAVDVRTGVTMRSPDGRIEIFYGDPEIPPFTVPNPQMEMYGIHEGMTLGQGAQTQTFQRYMPGQQFSASWGAHRVSKDCGQVAVQGSQPLPQLAQRIDMAYSQGGVRTSTQAGDAQFTCMMANGGLAQGYVFSYTLLAETNGFAMWFVPGVVGYVATADQAPQARALMAHVIQSFQLDPNWVQRQQGTTMKASEITRDTNNAVSDMIMSTWENKNASFDRAMQKDTEARRGVVTVQDPTRGPVQVDNLREHHWRLPNGAIVNSDSSYPPVQGAEELH